MLEFKWLLFFLGLAAALFTLKLLFNGTKQLERSEEEEDIALTYEEENILGEVRNEGRTMLFRIEKHANVPRIRELVAFGRIIRLIWFFCVILPILSLLIAVPVGGLFDLGYKGYRTTFVETEVKEPNVEIKENETEEQSNLSGDSKDDKEDEEGDKKEEPPVLGKWQKFRKGLGGFIFIVAYFSFLLGFYKNHKGIVYIYTNNVAVFELFGGYSFSAKYEEKVWKRMICPLWPFEKVRVAEKDEFPIDEENGEIRYYPTKRPWLLSLKVQMIDEPAQKVNTADGVINALVDYVQYFRIPYVLHLYAVYAVKELYPSVTKFANTKVFEIAASHKMKEMTESEGLKEMNEQVFAAVNERTSNWGMHTDVAQVKHVNPPQNIAEEMNLRAHAKIEKEKGKTKAELRNIELTQEGKGKANALKVLLESKAKGFEALAKSSGLEGDEKRLVLVIETLRDALEDSNYTLFTSSGGASEIASWIANIQQIIRAEDDVVPETKGKLERMLVKMKGLLDDNPELYNQLEKTLKEQTESKTEKQGKSGAGGSEEKTSSEEASSEEESASEDESSGEPES